MDYATKAGYCTYSVLQLKHALQIYLCIIGFIKRSGSFRQYGTGYSSAEACRTLALGVVGHLGAEFL
jgi:hypothetical protein